MAELQLGQTFDSHREVQQFVTSYCARNYHPVRQRHNMTVTSYNKKVKADSKLPDEIKYRQMTWECKHFGVYKCRGNRKRDYECVLAKDCRFQISVTFNRLLNKFVVTTAVLEHQNHEVSEVLYPSYASHRKLNSEQLETVDSMLLTNAKPTLVAEVLNKEGVTVCVKDLYNRKQKLMKFGNDIGNDIDEAVLSALNHPHIISRRITDEHNKFEALFFQTYTQRKLFASFSEVVQMDATFKAINMRYPLYTLLVIDSNGSCQPIAFGILVKKEQHHIENFLEIFKQFNDVTNLQCVIVDKDMAEVDALKKLFPAKCIQICYFHILKAVNNHLSTLKINNQVECSKKFDLVLQSKTEDDLAREMNELLFLSPVFHEYVVHHWLPFKENITIFGCKDAMHLQTRTDNRIESFHSVLKKVASPAGISLDTLISRLLSLVAERAYESVHRNLDMKMSEVASANPDLENYYRMFTDYAASLIGKEMDKSNSKMHRILNSCDGKLLVRNEETLTVYEVHGYRCSCNMPTNLGLPCRHIIATWKMRGERLFQPKSVADRWKRNLEHLDVSSTSLSPSSSTPTDYASASTSHILRFNTAMVALTDLASFAAEQPAEKFGDFMTAIDLFKNLATTGNVSALVNTLQTVKSDENCKMELISPS